MRVSFDGIIFSAQLQSFFGLDFGVSSIKPTKRIIDTWEFYSRSNRKRDSRRENENNRLFSHDFAKSKRTNYRNFPYCLLCTG